MAQAGNALSRNPNICASCSSMADGMSDSALPEPDAFNLEQNVEAETFAEPPPEKLEPPPEHIFDED